jgi:TolB-like protein/Flp pilus assembly protein TadD
MEQRISFGDYRFDVDSGRLWSGADELRITPKASAVLRMLVLQAGEPVAKEELFAAIWKDTAVTDDALTSCIQELRRVLADDAKQPRYIETRHRRGYRFVATLSPPQDSVAPLAVAAPVAASPAISSIAVLPFMDMSPERDQDYLCEGLAEELINALTRVDGLRVASRTASFQFRAAGQDIRAVGQHLGVATILEGSVRKVEDRLRVTVQLIEVANGYHRWSQRFDRKLDDVLAIQDDVAESIALSLRGSVLSEGKKPSEIRPRTIGGAYECYLRGRQYLHLMNEADLLTGAEMFAKALDLDPAYGPAWACLAAVHGTLYEWFGAKSEDLAKAQRASQRALELAPGLAQSHAARGFVLSLLKDYDGAARAFSEAIRLDPNFFEAYYYFGRSCFAQGDIARSAELFQQAGGVRPDDYQSMMLLGQSLDMLERKEEALAAHREGIRRAEAHLRLNPHEARALSLGTMSLFYDGQVERALQWAEQALAINPNDMSTIINAACLHLKLKQKEEALALLERVFARGWGKRSWIETDRDYDILRDDPRFQKLFAKLK